MSHIGSSGSSQPTQNQAFQASGTHTETSLQESAVNGNKHLGNAVDQQLPTSQSTSQQDATPSALGYGIHGAPAGEERHGLTESDVGRSKELDGEQMCAPGEGDVASSVEAKPGAVGGEDDFARDLDRKKKEQEPLRKDRSFEEEQKPVKEILNEHRQAN